MWCTLERFLTLVSSISDGIERRLMHARLRIFGSFQWVRIMSRIIHSFIQNLVCAVPALVVSATQHLKRFWLWIHVLAADR